MFVFLISDVILLSVTLFSKETRKIFNYSIYSFVVLFCVQGLFIFYSPLYVHYGLNKNVLLMSCAYPIFAYADRLILQLPVAKIVKRVLKRNESNWLYLFVICSITALIFHTYIILSFYRVINPIESLEHLLYSLLPTEQNTLRTLEYKFDGTGPNDKYLHQTF